MYMPTSLLISILTLSITPFTVAKKTTNPKNPPSNAILLSKIQSLTFRKGRKTTGRRLPPVPQLHCISSPEICRLYTPEVVRCTNEGSSYDKEDVEWACRADVPIEFKLGGTEVICEGYESADDPFVLKGSCALEYGLQLTDAGEEKFGIDYGSEYGGTGEKTSPVFVTIFTVAFCIVMFLIVKSMVDSCRRSGPDGRTGGPRRPGGGGGGGGGGSNDAPPPYDDSGSDAYTKPRGSSARPGSSNWTGQSWRPGPWTSAAAGAAAGYVAGARSNRATQTRNSWFGGDTGGGSSWGAGPSGGSGGSGSSGGMSSFSSSSRHESTGFGGTRRR